MRSIIVASVVFGVIALTRAFVINARMIRRDVNSRFDQLRARLEAAANAVVDDLFEHKPAE